MTERAGEHHYNDEHGLIRLDNGGAVRSVRRDGEIQWVFRCPVCTIWGDIDRDQFEGRVSIDHTDTGCTFHETVDCYSAVLGGP